MNSPHPTLLVRAERVMKVPIGAIPAVLLNGRRVLWCLRGNQ
jgi:hypothetical protein